MGLNTDYGVVEGESLVISTRMVVSTAAGLFEPEAVPNRRVSVGQVIGYVVNPSERVAIKSPFDGVVEAVTAWPKERVRKYQTLLALVAPTPGAAS